jgi:glycosyltransferase involved in cell wall biosynthesis
MKVALVYDRVNKWGGAERVLLALHEIYPNAPLYTAVYNRKETSWASVFPRVIPSFLQNFPFASKYHEAYPCLMPLAFESFNFDPFDVVISVTSEAAKGIITKPKTLHICYCLTPTRYLWSGYFHYKDSPRYGILNPLVKPFIPLVASELRIWDRIAAERPDFYLAISENVAQRINKYYRRKAVIIYPGVDLAKWQLTKKKRGDYFLVVSRLISAKRIDLVIEAFNTLGWPLKIIGDGSEMSSLKRRAHSNIDFLGQNLTDAKLKVYYQNCRALIFPGEEDFGLVSLEAQACGTPVIGYRSGGILETIENGVTGELFYPQTKEVLIRLLKKINLQKYEPASCRKNAERFDKEKFIVKFKQFVEDKWAQNQKLKN